MVACFSINAVKIGRLHEGKGPHSASAAPLAKIREFGNFRLRFPSVGSYKVFGVSHQRVVAAESCVHGHPGI